MATQRMTPEMTPAQESYLRDLIAIHELTPEQEAEALARLNDKNHPKRPDKATASQWIDRLKERPRRVIPADGPAPKGYLTVEFRPTTTDDAAEVNLGYIIGGENPVPRGRYAIPNPNPETQEKQDLAFYYVWVGDRGGWGVYQKAGPEQYRVSGRANEARIVRLIAKDPAEAMATYGRELGVCGMCGRELTNQESREYGIGPVCRGRL